MTARAQPAVSICGDISDDACKTLHDLLCGCRGDDDGWEFMLLSEGFALFNRRTRVVLRFRQDDWEAFKTLLAQ